MCPQREGTRLPSLGELILSYWYNFFFISVRCLCFHLIEGRSELSCKGLCVTARCSSHARLSLSKKTPLLSFNLHLHPCSAVSSVF